jgi:hypothetical protein
MTTRGSGEAILTHVKPRNLGAGRKSTGAGRTRCLSSQNPCNVPRHAEMPRWTMTLWISPHHATGRPHTCVHVCHPNNTHKSSMLMFGARCSHPMLGSVSTPTMPVRMFDEQRRTHTGSTIMRWYVNSNIQLHALSFEPRSSTAPLPHVSHESASDA